MKKTFFVVRPHSFVDVITNSSTELFVTSGEKSADVVREILEEKWPHYLSLYHADKEDYYRHNNLSDVLSVRVATAEDREDYNDWGWGDIVKEGDVLIEGVEDNSIPWHFFDVIEELFHCSQHHLG